MVLGCQVQGLCRISWDLEREVDVVLGLTGEGLPYVAGRVAQGGLLPCGLLGHLPVPDF